MYVIDTDAIVAFFANVNTAFGVNNLTSILVALIGVLAFKFHIQVNRKKFAFENFMKFSKAFNRATYLLSHGSKSSYFIVYTEFPKHFSAMLNFVHIFEGDCKDRFNNKWTEYENKCNEIRDYGRSLAFGEEDEFPEDFMIAESEEEIQKDNNNKKDLKRLINELLEIAKH